MKIAFVEIAGFRGFKDLTRFNFDPGFAVLTGRNGVGKSSVFDAIDFALTGSINKYQVTGAKGGGLDNHIWWIGDVSKFRSHYPKWKHTYAVYDILHDSYAVNAERWLESTLEVAV